MGVPPRGRLFAAAWFSTCLILRPALAGPTACADERGALTYTQFGCPSGTTPERAVPDGGRLSIITTPPLSDVEQDALARMERALDRERAQRNRSLKRAAARRAADREQARKQCEAATRALAGIEEARRQGYTLAEGRRYDAQETRWDAVRRTACR